MIKSKLEDYIVDLITPEDETLAAINRETYLYQLKPRMLSGHWQGKMLEMICRMISPMRVLEIGTFVGYSAVCMAKGMPEKGVLHTIETNDELEDTIQKNLSLAGQTDKVILHIGSALEIIPTLEDEFDLVFIDADKREYIEYYHAVFDKVRHKGFIVVDNVLWGGEVLDNNTDDPQTRGIIDFNALIKNDERVEKVLLPLRDGLFFIQKL